jgi:fucose 4-O-acetylase-like acetyltransferase
LNQRREDMAAPTGDALTGLRRAMAPPEGLSLDSEVSRRIRIARPVCILFMLWAHVNPGIAELDIASHGVRLADIYRSFAADGLARTSIGLLSLISGYLAIRAAKLTPFMGFLRKRARSLVIPMALWSALILLMYLAGERIEPGYFARQTGEELAWRHLPNWLFGFTDHPANLPLGFLRDLFVCSLLTPVFILGLRKARWAMLAGLFILMVTHLPSPFLGNNIPLFYALGLLMGMRGAALTEFVDRHAEKIWMMFLAYTAAIVTVHFHLLRHPGPLLEDVATGILEIERFFGAAAFWALAGWIARQPWWERIARLEPFAFFVFCSHLFVTTAAWIGFQALFGGYYHPAYPVFFTLAPVLAYGAGVFGASLLARLLPAIATVLNGGRRLPDHRLRKVF